MPRCLELLLAGIGILAISPLLLAIGVAVWLYDGRPVLFRARRIGRDGMEFHLLKFRTMVVGAEKRGGAITPDRDDRITPVGRILRRTKLDELPQLINVLLGEMSFVGPRPEDPRYVALYTDEQRRVLSLRPGITSPASLKYRDESSMLVGPDPEEIYVKTILPDKLKIELGYVRTKSWCTDVSIVTRTILSMFSRKFTKVR